MRLYFTNSAPSYTPGTWRAAFASTAGAANVALAKTRIGTNVQLDTTETSTTNNYKAAQLRAVSEPLGAAGTLGGSFSIGMARMESNAAANMTVFFRIYVTVGNSDTVRGTFYSDFVGATEYPTTLTAFSFTLTGTNVAVQAGDRVVIELGFNAANTSATAYTSSIRYGGTAADLQTSAPGTAGVTANSPWIDFASTNDALFADYVPFGSFADFYSQSFTGSAKTSGFHLLAADRNTSSPLGLVIELHGDGAEEYDFPTTTTLPAYNTVAKARNMILVCPKAPDTVGEVTWWENAASPQWLIELLDYIFTQYPAIDPTRVWFMGYSGGAEVQTYWLLSDYSDRIRKGGNIMLGGGGAEGLVFSVTPTSTFKTTQRLHWAVGELDTNDGTGFNAYAASQGGYDRYGTEGFTIRSRQVLPGKDHIGSETDGPTVLEAQLALAYDTTNTHTEQISTFEDGTSGTWTPTVGGAGTTAVRTADEHDGQYGISANVPAATGDKAGFTQTFTGVPQATVSGWWKVTAEGASGSNVPFARLFSGTQRLADVYRQNVSAGSNVWLRVVKAVGGSNYYFIDTGFRLELNTWVYISFTWGLDGNPYVWINGTQVLGPANKPADWFAATSIDTAYLGTHEAGNQGAWSMDTVTLSTNTAYQTINKPLAAEGLFSGSGTLSGAVTTVNYKVTSPFSSTGTLTTSVVTGVARSAGLSGSGTLSSSATPGVPKAAAFSGSGTLVGSGMTPAVTVAGGLSGAGTVSGTQTAATASVTAPLSSTGTLSRAVIAGFTASMNSSGVGTLGLSVGTISMQALAQFTGAGTLSSTQSVTITKSVAFTGSGTLSSTRTPAVSITANLSGDGSLTTSSSNSFTRTATLSGSGTLSGVITGVSLTRSVALSGSGTLTSGTVNNKSVSVNLTGSGALQGFLTSTGVTQDASLSGSGTLSGESFVTRMSTFNGSGSGTLTATAKADVMVEFNQASYGMLVVEFTAQRSVTAELVGVGLLIGDADDQKNYDVAGYLANNRWQGGLGSKRWKGKL